MGSILKVGTLEKPGLGLTEVLTGWPYPEGIWVDRQAAPWVYVAYVYLRLKEIPEAEMELEACHRQFLRELAPSIARWAEAQLGRVSRRRNFSAFQAQAFPYQPDEFTKRVKEIFKPWVNKWAIGSDRMLVWLLLCCIVEDIWFCCLGLSRRRLRRTDGKPAKELVAFATHGDKELGWAWEALLSVEYSRAEQATRDAARCKVQSGGFYRVRETTLARGADYFVRARILREKPLHRLAEDILSQEARNLLKILAPYDYALDWHRHPGAPLGVKHERAERISSKIFKVGKH